MSDNWESSLFCAPMHCRGSRELHSQNTGKTHTIFFKSIYIYIYIGAFIKLANVFTKHRHTKVFAIGSWRTFRSNGVRLFYAKPERERNECRKKWYPGYRDVLLNEALAAVK